jgi:hypothetical protein
VGAADESLILDKICEADIKLRMPPEGEPLSGDEIDAIRRWINAGAPAPVSEPPMPDPRVHWSFRPVVRPQVPEIGGSNAIDAFLSSAQRQVNIDPLPEADRSTLLRRLCLDLTGLTPTLNELSEFASDDRADAYERAVDRMLASPHYGERWGRHWMDVWRYSDWYGWQNEVRHSQPHIWRWRDWIVESLNASKGYDRMVVEMLAADEIAPENPETLRATGYLVRNWFKFNRHVWLQDTVDHTAKAFLGLTVACARCHDHKYDPIAQTDYYRLRAFFEPHEIRTDPFSGQAEATTEGLVRVYDAHSETPTYVFTRGDDTQPNTEQPLRAEIPAFLGHSEAVETVALPPRSYYPPLRAEVRALERERVGRDLAASSTALENATSARIGTAAIGSEAVRLAARLEAAQKRWVAARAARDFLEARIQADDARFALKPDSKRAEVEAFRAGFFQVQYDLFEADAKCSEAHQQLLESQLKANAGDKAASEQISSLREAMAKAETRLSEAGALARSGKPNKDYRPIASVYPAQSTGRRLALARWITDAANPLTARVAVNHVWMRHFGEPLVASVFDFGNHGSLPTHPELLDWLASELVQSGWDLKHLHRLIVTSAAYRRASAWTSSAPQLASDPNNITLWRMNSRRLEAELVRDNLLSTSRSLETQFGGIELDQNTALSTGRRSLYYRHAPEKQVEFLKLFDAANMEACYRRDVSIVPQQALALANSSLALASARRLARLINDEATSSLDDGAFVDAAFQRVLARTPTAEERVVCREFLAEQTRRLSETSGWSTFEEGPESLVPAAMDPAVRARENLVHALYNHNEFVTIR